MATFVIIPIDEASVTSLADAMRGQGASAYPLPRGEWLMKFEGTPKQLSELLKITSSGDREAGGPLGIVAHFSGYWGHAPKDIWDWIGLNQT